MGSCCCIAKMGTLTGLEPATSCATSRRSIHLNYRVHKLCVVCYYAKDSNGFTWTSQDLSPLEWLLIPAHTLRCSPAGQVHDPLPDFFP